MYNYRQYLVDNIHELFLYLTTNGVFRYSSVIIHFILFQLGDSLHIQPNRQDEQGVNQSVIHWTKLVEAASSRFTFSQFIDSFVHPVLQLLNN